MEVWAGVLSLERWKPPSFLDDGAKTPARHPNCYVIEILSGVDAANHHNRLDGRLEMYFKVAGISYQYSNPFLPPEGHRQTMTKPQRSEQNVAVVQCPVHPSPLAHGGPALSPASDQIGVVCVVAGMGSQAGRGGLFK
jgi:hypothetical protein